MLGRDVGEDDAVRDFGGCPLASGGEEVRFSEIREAEKPEDGVGNAGEDAEPGAESGGFDLVELIEVGEDYGVIRKLWEKLFAHLPAAGLFFVPACVLVSGVGCALSVVTAEESIAAVDDVLTIDPVVVVAAAVVVNHLIFKVDVTAPRSKSLRRHCSFVCKEIITPFCAESAGKAHERHLYGSRPSCEDLIASPTSVAVQVDQDVDAIAHDLGNQSFSRP